MAKAKTINLLLEDGTLDGLITMADSQWNSGELYSVPRAQAETILSSDAVKKFGVYLLLSFVLPMKYFISNIISTIGVD